MISDIIGMVAAKKKMAKIILRRKTDMIPTPMRRKKKQEEFSSFLALNMEKYYAHQDPKNT